MQKCNKDRVFETYEQIFEWFDQSRTRDLSLERQYLEYAVEQLSNRSQALDLGCGTGEPIAQYLSDHGCSVTGVDASQKMIDCCWQRFPSARWVHADMRSVIFQEAFDLVLAWHSLFHLPHQDQRLMLCRIGSWVKPGGLFLFTSGPEFGEVWSNNGGCELYHASLSLEEYRSILLDLDFEVVTNRVKDPQCGGATVWLTQKVK